MDDAVHVIDNSVGGRLRGAIKRLTRTRAYGRGLSLLQTEGREAFGFRWKTRKGRVEIEQEFKWITDFKKLWGLRRPDNFYKAGQMDTNKRQRGVLVGYLLRIADCTNVKENVIVMRLRRVVLEMLVHGHSKSIVQSALREVSDQLLCDLRQVTECLDWSTEEQNTFRLCHDTSYGLEEYW